MSEAAQASLPVADVSAGTLLRRAREAAGLHVAALAVALKVPVRKLEALEEDRYEDMGDAVFIRALASSVCRTLKVDPQPVLERLPQTAAPRLVKANEGLNAPFRAPSDSTSPVWVDALRRPVPLTVIALLVGAVAIYFLPIRYQEEPSTPASVASTPAPAMAAAPAPAAAASEPAPTPVVSAAVTTTVAAAAAPEASAARPTASSAAAAASAAAPVPTSGIVVFRTKGESWVEVVDAKGGVAIRKLMTAGETAGASGALPLAVTIGRVDMTDVEVRGKKFDMRPVSKDNVARFEVK